MDKVLIAEDDREQLKRLVIGLGKYKDKFEIIQVTDGQEAISVLKQEPVSLVVTDIQMPRINGMVLLAYVNTYHPNIPCFVTTAYGTSRLKSKLPQDLLRFFEKPFEIKDLAQAIIAALEGKSTGEARKGISLASFLYLIEMERASCTLEIEMPDEAYGLMYFENGILYDAECGDFTGEAAALELISRGNLNQRFKFSPPKEITRRIKTGIEDLIRNVRGSGR